MLGGECDFGQRGTTVWKFPGEPIKAVAMLRQAMIAAEERLEKRGE